ncbi:MAG: 2-C-methyl-D-erythritol 4-phosphate cytidylyltransferase [Bacteroidaceae bacterium]|nr:2-C-methyl-D-erythritol 4-phosphate cytidylyltransferase [Bacteroidaceae bacterium]
MKRYVVIVAGGRGLRMGGEVPKQFRLVGGRPVLMRTVEAFVRAYSDISVVLVLPRDQQDYWQSLCREYDFRVPLQVADGGETRFASVRNGLALIPDEADCVVGVHDGVRPFVTAETIRRCYESAQQQRATVPVVPVVETVRRLLPDGGSRTVAREAYRLVQTPQTFPLAMLKAAYAQPYVPSFTDDASVVERMGLQIHLVDGDRRNIKLTTPEDIMLAEALCRI